MKTRHEHLVDLAASLDQGLEGSSREDEPLIAAAIFLMDIAASLAALADIAQEVYDEGHT